VSLLGKDERGPLLCYVTDLRAISSRAPENFPDVLVEKIGAAARAGVNWIQIREKQLTAKECSALVGRALERVAEQRAAILVNDRADMALALQAGGVHLPENSLPPQEVKQLARTLGREQDFLVGVSCHSLSAAKVAAETGADYLFFGPVFPTPSKAAYGPPQGLERLAEVCRVVSVPVLAVGGITPDNGRACLSAGAAGLAAIRLFQDSVDLPERVRILRS